MNVDSCQFETVLLLSYVKLDVLTYFALSAQYKSDHYDSIIVTLGTIHWWIFLNMKWLLEENKNIFFKYLNEFML